MRYTLTSSDVQFDSWQIIQICIAFLKKTNKQKKQKNKVIIKREWIPESWYGNRF